MVKRLGVLERFKAVRLSGWARLWIVLLGLFWAFSAWSSLIAEHENWQRECNWAGCPSHPEQKWPGNLVVQFYSDGLKRSEYEIPRASEESKPTGGPNFSSRGKLVLGGPDYTEVTASDGTILQFPKETQPEAIALAKDTYEREQKVAARAELNRRNELRFQHYQRLAAGIFSPAMHAVLAFVLAMLAKAAVLWIWRGFNASKGG